ncbi:rCG57046 [Rattus norvegicus]|uniref:RCG57046 n=1 Tax=Rattus norvegicus TaxID=10116 RepID=A6JCZ8_RAT|nr:rCG57046 [Rattus norvegicus]
MMCSELRNVCRRLGAMQVLMGLAVCLLRAPSLMVVVLVVVARKIKSPPNRPFPEKNCKPFIRSSESLPHSLPNAEGVL